MRRHKSEAAANLPVFFDPSGKRWRRTILTSIPIFVAIFAILGWVAALATAPLWAAAENSSSNYPQYVTNQTGTVPVIGEGDLKRVDIVKHSGSNFYLTDPYTNKVLRRATATEAKTIGSHSSVIEYYSYLPDHRIALTFDDGPSAQYTPQILSILEQYHVPATFFVIGNNVLANSSLVDREVHDGDAIGIHTMTHIHFTDDASVFDREELVGDDRLIRTVAGYGTRIWRIPYSDDSEIGLLTAQQLGYQEVEFDLDTHDWQYTNKPVPVPKLDGSGHVVIMHDGGTNRQATVTLLVNLIKEAQAQHYTFVTVSALLPTTDKPTLAPASMVDRFSSFGWWLFTTGTHEIIATIMYTGLFLTGLLTVIYIVVAYVKHARRRMKTWPKNLRLPPVTVLIPAHNEERVLAATLSKLSLSEHPEFEVIVIANGCNDKTEEIARDFASVWPCLRVLVSQPGKAYALNAGIEAARYDVIVTMDADTHFRPDTLSKLVRHFIDSRVGGVAGHIKVGNLRNILARCQAPEYLMGISVMRLTEGVVVAPGACAAFRKCALIEAGGFVDDTHTEDLDITMRVRRKGWIMIQENDAVAWTEAPETLRDLSEQRLRWMYGTLQGIWKHRDMFFRPRYGWLGMYVLPYHLLSMAVTLVVVPLMYIGMTISIITGHWQSLLVFTAIGFFLALLPTFVAILISKEQFAHLFIVPVASAFLSLLRAYVLYVTIVRIIKGQTASTIWDSPQRNDSVAVPIA